MLALVAFAVTTMLLLSANDLELVGKPSPAGWFLYATTLAVPALGAVALLRALMGAEEANLFVRGLAWLNGVVVTGFAGYMYAYGWIAMKIWE